MTFSIVSLRSTRKRKWIPGRRPGWLEGNVVVAPGGRLSALMLDTKSTFDLLVSRNASTPEQAQRILENTFYRNVSGALGGTQEYMAMEKLHELYDEGNFDLIVVDPPPPRHAGPRRSRLSLAVAAAARPGAQGHRRRPDRSQ